MNESRETLLEFPCQYPIKAMGLTEGEGELDALVAEIVRRHVEDLPEGAVTSRPSSNGKYTAVTVTFTARSKAQLDAIYLDLTGHERIMTVL